MEQTQETTQRLPVIKDIFDFSTIELPSLEVLLWGFFMLIALYAIAHAAVFVYHWGNYNIAPGPFLRRTYLIYFSGLGIFLFLLFLSTVAILS